MSEIESLVRTKIDGLTGDIPESKYYEELKEELITDLTELAEDYAEDGFSNEEAVEKAFERLNDFDRNLNEESDSNSNDKGKFGEMPFFKKGVSSDNGPTTKNIFSRLKLVNSQTFNLLNINNVVMSYENDDVEIYSTDEDELLVQEYMNRKSSRYFLKKKNTENSDLYLTNGDRPVLWQVHTKIKVFIPKSYSKEVSILNSNGSIKIMDFKNFSLNLQLSSKNGRIKAKNVEVENLTISTHNSAEKIADIIVGKKLILNTNNGAITGVNISGEIEAESNNGSIKMTNIYGSGNFESHSGSIKVNFKEIRNDICGTTDNGRVRFSVDKNQSYIFTLESGHGTVKGPTHNVFYDFSATGFAKGKVGNEPQYEIKCSTNHGAISLN